MKITEEYYAVQMYCVEDRYLNLAKELTEQMLECLNWECNTKEVNAQIVIALWLKNNEIHCKEE